MTRTPASKKNEDALHRAYLFTGEVDARRDAALQDLITRMVSPGNEDFDLSKFDGAHTDAESVIAAAMTLPLASERKVVIVNYVDRMNADDQVRVASFLPKLGPMACLIMLAGNEDAVRQKSKGGSASKASPKTKDGESSDEDEEEQEGKKRKKGLQPEVTKAVKAHGKVLDFAKMKSDDVTRLVAQKVAALGKQADPSVLQGIARTLASTPWAIDKELEKLATYVGERGKITPSDVDAVITRSPEDRIFPLIDAIGARRSDTAIQLLSETLAASTKVDSEVLKITSMLARHFRMMYQVKYLKSQGIRNLTDVPEELQEVLAGESRNSPLSLIDWQRNKLADQSNAFSLAELETCMREILACELASKGIGKGDGSPRLHLETLVFKLSRRAAR